MAKAGTMLLAASASGVGAAVRVVAARPLLFGSVALFGALSGVVADNAINRQTGRHPHPMLSTRPDPAAAAGRTAARTPRTATERAEIANDPRILAFPLVREVQSLLAERGLYTAAVDGRAGQATDLAIRRFQTEEGLRVDGMATPLLLTQIRQASDPEASADRDEIAALTSVDPGATAGISSGAADADLVRRIQEKLNEAAVAEVAADGILGERTRAAIRTFQALESLDVTGEPTPEVLARLEAVDAGR